MNKKPEITLPAVHCIYVIKFQLESLLLTYHILSYFGFHSLFPVKKCKLNRSFSCKAPRLAFSFLPPVRFEIFTAAFSGRIVIFPIVHRLRKSDYSSLMEKMIFTDYWKVVMNFSVVGNTVFFSAKKLMERWYLLVTEKFLFWTFQWWETRSFFQPRSWWKDDIYLVFQSFPWNPRTWQTRFFVQWW